MNDITDEQIDAVFKTFAGVNDHGTPYLRCYEEGFRSIARAILSVAGPQALLTDRQIAQRIANELDRPLFVEDVQFVGKVREALAGQQSERPAPAGHAVGGEESK